MTSPDPGTRHSRRWWWVAIAMVIVAGAVLFGFGLVGQGSSLPGPAVAASTATHPRHPPATVARSTLVVSVPSPPSHLAIPRLGVSVALGTLGTNPDGTVEVPSTADQAGWFRLGPFPGQVGSAVVLGHVDSWQGPGVFFGLRTLVPGDRIEVTLASGVVAEFSVTAVATYVKEAFPAREVYGSHGVSALQLVTCGGAFDEATRSYLSNVVVYSTLVGTVPATASVQAMVGP
jgi:sortase (surface protein transpeptidase)